MKRLALALGLMLAGAAAAQDAPHAPFITTPDEVVERMLALAGTRADDFVVDLGSGDGRIVIAAARKFGARGLGIELDAGLVERSREAARGAGVAERVAFVQGDVLLADISRASVVTVYLLPELLNRLQPRFLKELRPGTRIVTHAFPMVSWAPDRVETLRLSHAHRGQGDESRLYLWIVPAEARGRWRGSGTELTIYQNFQQLELEGRLAGEVLQRARGVVQGREVLWDDARVRFRGRIEGDRIAGEMVTARRRLPLLITRGR